MSMEIFVLSDRRLASMAEWQQAIDKEGFDLRLDQSRPIEELGGHLPAWRGEQRAGFECEHFDPAGLFDDESFAEIDFGHRWTYLLALGFGRDFHALWGAFAAAAAYARATGGVVFDAETGEMLQPDDAAEAARSVEPDLAAQ